MRFFKYTFVFLLLTIATQAKADNEAYDRVMQSNTLNCGYIVVPPQFIKDPNTGEFSGVAYDITMDMAQRLGLKVEWTEELNFGTMAEGLNTGRYDAICFSLYRWAASARAMDYSMPLFCTGTDVYVRADDERFDGNLDAINREEVTIASIDAEGAETIAREDYPNAKIFSMPQNTDLGGLMLAVETKKADVAFANPLMATPYLTANPGKLKNVTEGKPIRFFCHALAFGKGETKLASTVSLVLEEMHNSGAIDKILKKWEKIPNSYMRIAKPYQVR